MEVSASAAVPLVSRGVDGGLFISPSAADGPELLTGTTKDTDLLVLVSRICSGSCSSSFGVVPGPALETAGSEFGFIPSGARRVGVVVVAAAAAILAVVG